MKKYQFVFAACILLSLMLCLGACDGQVGPQGLPGAEGATGVPGSDGVDGKDGVSVANVYIGEDGHLYVVLSDARIIDAGCINNQSSDDQNGNDQTDEGKTPSVSYTEPTIVISNLSAEPGEVVEVPVYIINNPGIAGGTLTVSYGPSLELIDVAYGEVFDVLDHTDPASLVSGLCRLNVDSLNSSANGDGCIAKFTFRIKEDAFAGNMQEVSLSYTEGDIYSADLNDVYLNVVNGYVEVVR